MPMLCACTTVALPQLRHPDVKCVIVCAGMDGALPGVVLGLGAGGRESMPKSSKNAMASLNNDRWRYWNLYYKIERKVKRLCQPVK